MIEYFVLQWTKKLLKKNQPKEHQHVLLEKVKVISEKGKAQELFFFCNMFSVIFLGLERMCIDTCDRRKFYQDKGLIEMHEK